MRWPTRRMLLWHNDSPGERVVVDVRWPRYLWLKGPDEHGFPRSFATCSEVLRDYRRRCRACHYGHHASCEDDRCRCSCYRRAALDGDR